MCQRSAKEAGKLEWDQSFDASFAPPATSTPKKQTSPPIHEYQESSTPLSTTPFDLKGYGAPRRIRNEQPSIQPEYSGYLPSPNPIYAHPSVPKYGRPMIPTASDARYGRVTTPPPSTSNYGRPMTAPSNTSKYGKPLIASAGTPSPRLAPMPIYSQIQLSSQSPQQPFYQPQQQSPSPPRPEPPYPERQNAPNQSPGTSRYGREQSPQSTQQQARLQKSIHPNPTPYTPLVKITKRIVYETNFNPESEPQPQPQLKPQPQSPQIDSTNVWNQMKHNYAMHKHNLRQQQALERQMYPNESYLREKHALEINELDVLYQKNRLKLMHKLQHNLDTTPTDEELFANLHDSTMHSQTNYVFQNRQPNVSRTAQNVTPQATIQTNHNRTTPPRTETLPITPRRLEFPEPVSPPYGIRNNSTYTLPAQKDGTSEIGGKCNPCSSRVGKMEQINHNFITDARNILQTAFFRRKDVNAAIDRSVNASSQMLDCRQKKAQDAALRQFEINLDAEVSIIYHDLLHKRQQIAQGMNPYHSIDASHNQSHPADEKDLTEEERMLEEEFAETIIEAIDEDSIKIIAINEESESFYQKNSDILTVLEFQTDCKNMIDQMEEQFLALWKEFEKENCSCSSKSLDKDNELAVEIGNAMLEVFTSQYKVSAELEKLLSEECTGCQAEGSKSPQNADRQELKNVLVELANDMWAAMESVRAIFENKNYRSSSLPNFCTVIRAMLAIYRKCTATLKEMLNLHKARRRMSTDKDLSSIFVEEWNQLRSEINDDLTNIIASLHYGSNAKMTCQERHLKRLQGKEKEALLEKYSSQGNKHPCRAGELDNTMNEELEALNDTHLRQWNMMLNSKLQRKIDQIDKIFPKESKEACAQTCSKKVVKDMPEIVEEETEADNCECKPSDEPKSEHTMEEHEGNDVAYEINKNSNSLGNAFNSSHLPDLNELNSIEDEELNVLQQNLRQWQLARRNLLESINHSMK